MINGASLESNIRLCKNIALEDGTRTDCYSASDNPNNIRGNGTADEVDARVGGLSQCARDLEDPSYMQS
jgi:hypothetical protein